LDWFARRLLRWFDSHGRKDLPWQRGSDAYRVWLSEIMLQQTQVATVIPYFERFIDRFPTVADLASAGADEVLHHWTGLGYYARARNLHHTARQVVQEHAGQFPQQPSELEQLPGIGRSTAAAIAAIAYGRRAAILDGNAKRVLARYHAVPGHPGQSGTLKTLWARAEDHTPARRVADYTQAIMDLGATLCTRTRPACSRCPVAERCEALARNAVERYPERRPARDKPERRARMYLFVDAAGACLLERRPPDGLWGGLWTPPERSADSELETLCREFGIALDSVIRHHAAPAFRHTFTHFHLDIEPVYVFLSSRPQAVADGAGLIWYEPEAPEAVGLSAPAAKLLNSIADQREEFRLT